jgi:hypothetical protein
MRIIRPTDRDGSLSKGSNFAPEPGECAVGESGALSSMSRFKARGMGASRQIEISPFFHLTAGIVGQLTGIVLALAAYHGE